MYQQPENTWVNKKASYTSCWRALSKTVDPEWLKRSQARTVAFDEAARVVLCDQRTGVNLVKSRSNLKIFVTSVGQSQQGCGWPVIHDCTCFSPLLPSRMGHAGHRLAGAWSSCLFPLPSWWLVEGSLSCVWSMASLSIEAWLFQLEPTAMCSTLLRTASFLKPTLHQLFTEVFRVALQAMHQR